MPCRLSQPQPCDIKPKTTLATAFGRLVNWLGWRNKSSTTRSAQATVVCIYTLMRPRSPRTPTAGSLRLPKQCLFFLFSPSPLYRLPGSDMRALGHYAAGAAQAPAYKVFLSRTQMQTAAGAMILIRYRDPVDFFSGLLGPLIYVCRRCDETRSCHMTNRKLSWVNSHRRRACLVLAQLCQTPCYHGAADIAPSVSQPLGCQPGSDVRGKE